MKKCIIQFSDLHICNQFDDNGILIENSWVNLKSEYLNVLVKNIEKILLKKKAELASIIISGDLANSSDEQEYVKVNEFFEKLAIFKIPKEKILIIPGNHDINWDLNKAAFKNFRIEMEKNGQDWKIRKPYTFNNEKFSNFISFYNSFFENKKFNPDNSIVDIVSIDEFRLLLIGINSIFHESYIGEHYGWIEKEKLRMELDEIPGKYSNFNKVAIIHHNLTSFNNETRFLKNWNEIQSIFTDHNIFTFFFGHEHTSGSQSSDYGEISINFCETGSLAKPSVTCYFNLYNLTNYSSKFSIFRESYHFIESKDGIHSNTGFWNLTSDEYKKEFVFYSDLPKPKKPSKDLLRNGSLETSTPFPSNEPTKEIERYSQNLFDIIKTHKSFKTGHFHWTEESRTLNWLDTSIIYKKNNYLDLAKASIIELIRTHSLEFDIAIGLGIEGNLLSSSISYYFNKKYSYIPYVYRDPDHLTSEKKLLTNNGFKKVIVIDQIVHKATSINKLIKSEHKFFKGIENLYLLSLFYTGEMDYRPDIFQTIDKRIVFYSVCNKFKIQDCPKWEKSNEEMCQEQKSNLHEVIEFYSNKKKDENNKSDI